ncbi:MAG: hypothetical protein A2Y54_02915 [Chloroflexi bacterium RBG_16_51_16]|nr:MAG: hypothetical protein A2Y54_02915 [Chloroflexi bacterium RBG_16_51_16]
MVDYNIGKGVYIWKPEKIEKGNPYKILGRLQLAGVQSAAIKICDGINVVPNLEPLIRLLRANQIRVIGWGYSYLGRIPTREAQAISSACQKYEIDMYLIDVEHEVEGNYTGAGLFIEALRYALPETALGLNTFWNVGQHPSFPWRAFLSHVDFTCPQLYWRGQRPLEKLRQSKQEYAALVSPDGRKIPMRFVGGDMFTERGIKPSISQLIEFMNAVESDPDLQGVLMWAADDNETTSDLWQTFSGHHWQKGGRIPPQQPAGWAQIKYGMHVRAEPKGEKIRGLVKNNLVPIWELSESRWAAISPDRDEWIYLGDPNLVEVNMETPKAVSKPTLLYRAVVTPVRGLNVRKEAFGTVIRTLRSGEVVDIYQLLGGWARIHPAKDEWVNASYLRKVEPVQSASLPNPTSQLSTSAEA